MVSSELWFGAEASFYNDVATQSLRFNDPDSSVLSRTPSSSGNRQVWTVSFWIKRTKLAHGQGIASTYTGSPATANTQWSWESDDAFMFYDYHSSYQWRLKTNRLFRDVGSWYHIVLAVDTTQATSSNRIKIYVNGEQETSFSAETYPSQNLNTADWNTTQTHYIGRHSTLYLDGYMAEFNNIDGLQLDPTHFGETKNGVWIAKEYTGSYGTNGFRLQFNQTGTGTASASTIGADTSGNNNHFTSSGIVASDCNMPDSPENNWATLNSIYNPKNNPPTFSEGNLKATASQVAYQNTFSTIGVSSGKWYVEMKQNGTTNSANFIGIVDEEAFDDFQDHSHYIGSATVEGVNYGYNMHNGNKYVDGTSSSYGSRTNDGEIIGIALDLDNGKLYFSVDGTFVASGDPVNGTNFMAENIPSGTYFFGTTLYQNGYTSGVWNFGEDSSFGGTETATSNSDVNSNGTFHTAPPTGYLALCSANLPEPTISPNQATQADDHFNTVLWTGNGTNPRTISGVGFQPDWVWHKPRTLSLNHLIWDSSRGAGSNSLLTLFTNITNDESNSLQSQGNATSFASDGFIVNAGSSGDNHVNDSDDDYVAWNWLANGTTPTKTYKVKVVADSTDYGHGSGANKYQFFKSDGTTGFGTNGVDIDLQEGGTYVFDWSDSSAQGHPLRFSLTNNGTHGGGSEYTTGVVKDDSAYTTTITVASGVANLYYYCQLHSGMGAEVRTNTTHGSTNFDGSILSVSNANTTSGFSIVTFTGTGSNATVGHGLSVAPTMIIFKNRDNSYSWSTYVKEIGASYRLTLEETSGRASSSTSFNSTDPTSSVFSVGTNVSTNKSGDKIIAYCFHSVDGYSKCSSYTGNGSTDGTFVYTGFSPAWVIIKNTDSTVSWTIFDKEVDANGGNAIDKYFHSNSNSSQGTAQTVDFLSNGFKFRLTNTTWNGNGNNIIYLAFAEVPFKYANAR